MEPPAQSDIRSEADWTDASSDSASIHESQVDPTQVGPEPVPECQTCKKPESESTPLKRCARCHQTRYCSRDCQKAEWKTHKKACATSRKNDNGRTDTEPPSQGPRVHHVNPDTFSGLLDGTYLETLPRPDAMRQLIDSYRLRIEDEYTFRGDAGGLYAQEPPMPDFRRYLNRAEKRKRPRILPSWWDKRARVECERIARTDKWSNVHYAVEKHDIVEHYGDPLMPLKLRSIAEKVEGSSVQSFGFDGF